VKTLKLYDTSLDPLKRNACDNEKAISISLKYILVEMTLLCYVSVPEIHGLEERPHCLQLKSEAMAAYESAWRENRNEINLKKKASAK